MSATAQAIWPPRLDRIGIVMMSAVGDAVHVLPVATALKRHAPHSHISWVLQPAPAALVRGHWAIDELIVFERARGWRAFADVRRALADRPFDLVLDLQVYLKAGLVTALTRSPVKLGFDRGRARDLNWVFTTHRIPAHPSGQHVQDQYLEFLDALGVPHGPPSWDLGPWPSDREAQHEFYATMDRPVAAIVVATSKSEKDWIPDRWARVARALDTEFGVQVVLVGGTSARERAAAAIIRQQVPGVVSALGSGLRPLVGLLDGAALVLAPDTGPLHIAVALGRPVIGLYGYTNPKRTGPYRRFQDLIVDAYGDPGENYPVSMELRPGRMPRITVDDVLDKVRVWKETYGALPAGPKDLRDGSELVGEPHLPQQRDQPH
jgi:heptosyltransferase I